jgi:acylphosphatase
VIARRVRVSGRVQGVFFRRSAAERARSRGVSGWVRNCADGSVEAWFEGDRDAVEAMIEWCRSGPRGASVERVGIEDAEPSGARGFDVR